MTMKIPQRNPDLVWRNLEGEGVLLNPKAGKYFGLNAVGQSFWEKIDGMRSLEDILQMLLVEYAVTRSVLEPDILELCEKMNAHGLLTWKS